MTSASSLLVVLLAAALLLAAAMLLRSGSALPWPAIIVAALTSAVCFTVGGTSGEDTSGPSVATVMGAVVGFVTVVAAVLALVPRSETVAPPSRTPLLLAVGGIVLGALGLPVHLLTS